MDQPQHRPAVERDIDAYSGIEVIETRWSAIAAYLRARPSSDLALIGVYSCLLMVGGRLAASGQVLGAIGVCVLGLAPYLVASIREERHRAAQARSTQHRDQLDSQAAG